MCETHLELKHGRQCCAVTCWSTVGAWQDRVLRLLTDEEVFGGEVAVLLGMDWHAHTSSCDVSCTLLLPAVAGWACLRGNCLLPGA